MCDECFGNLHLHSHSSLIDGLGRPSEIVAKAKRLGQPYVAVSDHGSLGAVPEMYRECKKSGIQLIAGIEAYLVPDAQALGFGEKGNLRDSRNFHLTLLAKNERGYKDLVKLVSQSMQPENYYYKPRMDYNMLREVDTENLICLSGCVASELSETFLNHLWPIAAPRGAKKYEQWRHVRKSKADSPEVQAGLEAAREVMKFYRNLFPDGQYFYEFMYHDFAPESWAHHFLIPEAKRYGIPIVATNDSHYVEEEHAEAHNLLMSIQWKQQYCANPDDPKLLDMASAGQIVDRLSGLLPKKDILAGIKNTQVIADMCSGFKITPLERRVTMMPKSVNEEGEHNDKPITRIKHLSKDRLDALLERYPEKRQVYLDRFEHELRVIRKLKYQHYFLVVADIIRRAKEKKIIVGPGRGSGAGSLVAYCMSIVDIDPIRHDLLFERFLNPAKKSLPDFDTDFQSDRIDEVFADISDVYGEDNVRRVCTYHRYAPKALMTDVLKTLPTNLSHDEVKEITKELPEDTRDRKDEAFMETWWADVRRQVEDDKHDTEHLEQLLKWGDKFPIEAYSHQFYGIRKAVSTHAAGVIISDGRRAISDWVPDQYVPASKTTVTQYDMNDLADMGFVKVDALALGTLTQIADCLELTDGYSFPQIMDYEDEKTYELLTSGHTDGVFQLGGYAAKQVIKQLGGVRDFDDIVAVTALCRPGAGKFVGTYRDGRENPDAVEYASDADREIMAKTYGVIMFQEQVMALGWAIGMTDDEVSGDVSLLTAIKKYSKTIMDQVEPIFREKAAKCGWSEEFIDLRWSNIADYVGYSFNASHAVAYSDLTFRTAYLKANYPAAFIVSRMKQAMSGSDRKKRLEMLDALVQDARRVGVKVLPPHINKSKIHFSITDNGNIRWGLADVKGIGERAAREMIANRPFRRKDWRENDKGPRGGRVAPHLLRVEKKLVTAAVMGALQRLGAFPGYDPGDDRYANERELLGVNTIEHTNKKVLKQIKSRVFDEENQRKMRARKKDVEHSVRIGGVVTRIKEITTKKGRKMAFVNVTLTGETYDLTIFPNEWEGTKDYARGTVDSNGVHKKVREGRLLYAIATRRHDEIRGWNLIADSVSIYK